MSFAGDHEALFDRLDEELRHAEAPEPILFAKIVADICTRVPRLSGSGSTNRIDRLLAAGAWTDAAMALIQLELPGWKSRRLAYENGEWLCSLSCHPTSPLEFDDTADANHDVMSLAILRAFLQARRMVPPAPRAASAVSQIQADAQNILCCDNFA